MNERAHEVPMGPLEDRSRALFHESVDGLDLRVRSRLTQARYAALAVAASRRRSWRFRLPIWAPALGVTAAALACVALWFGTPLGNLERGSVDNQSNLDDLEIIAASDEGSGVSMEMLQDDLEFYDFADRAVNSPPAA